MGVFLSAALISLMLLTCHCFLWLTPRAFPRIAALAESARINRLVRRECAELDRDYEQLLRS